MVCTLWSFRFTLPEPHGMLETVIKVKRRFYGPIGPVNENVIRILLIEFEVCPGPRWIVVSPVAVIVCPLACLATNLIMAETEL